MENHKGWPLNVVNIKVITGCKICSQYGWWMSDFISSKIIQSPRKGIRIYLSSLSRILAFNAAHLFGGKEAYLKLPHLVGEIHRSKILAHPVSWLDNTDPQRHPHSTNVCESPWHGFRQPNLTSWSQLWLNARMYSMYTIYSCLTYDLDCFSVPLLKCFRFHHYNYNARTYTWEHDHLTLFFSSPRSNKLGKSCSLLARIGTWRCIERYVPCYEPWWGVKHSCCQRWWCVQKWDCDTKQNALACTVVNMQISKKDNCISKGIVAMVKKIGKKQELWCYVVCNMSCVLLYVTYVPNFIFMYFMYIIYVFDLYLDYMCDIILIHVVHARVSLDVMYIQHTLRYQPCRGTSHYSDSGPQAHGRETWGQVICYSPPLPSEKIMLVSWSIGYQQGIHFCLASSLDKKSWKIIVHISRTTSKLLPLGKVKAF